MERINSLKHLMCQAAFQLYILGSEDRIDGNVIKHYEGWDREEIVCFELDL